MAQPSAEVLSVKDAVRRRDGMRCTGCHISNEEHKRRRGRQLEVHRLSPGSRYTVEGCVTFCLDCHPRHVRRVKGQPDEAYGQLNRNVRIPPDLLADLEIIEQGMGLDLSSVIRMILTEHRAEYVARIRARQQPPASS